MEEDYFAQLFRKFAGDNNYLTFEQFKKLIIALSKHESELNYVVKSLDCDYIIKAVFLYYSFNQYDKLSFEETYNWWISSDKYSFFSKKRSVLLVKAKRLYLSYTKNNKMTYDEFANLLEHLKINQPENTFDNIDANEDGLVSFREFFDWLNWK